jgi:hypothetical protein
VDACDGHRKSVEWVPGECHHVDGPVAVLGKCWCLPSWAREREWTHPLVVLEDVDAGRATGPDSWAQAAVDWSLRHWDEDAIEATELDEFFDDLLLMDAQELADVLTKDAPTWTVRSHPPDSLEAAYYQGGGRVAFDMGGPNRA